jgi:hypothetical protein
MVVKLQCQSCSGYVELLKNTKHAAKADLWRAKKLGLSKTKLSGGSTHPTVPVISVGYSRIVEPVHWGGFWFVFPGGQLQPSPD